MTADGKLIAATPGDARRPVDGGPATTGADGAVRAGLLAGPGQHLRVVDVPDSLATLTDADEFGRRMTAELTRRGLL
ncbi:MAG TPA: hypothetical protein VGD67_24675 [Pseudonocardiaceae bacterium]